MKKSKTILGRITAASFLVMPGVISNAQPGTSAKLKAGEEIRTFKVHVAEAQLNDLHRRILATNGPIAKRSRMNRKVCSLLRCRLSPTTGRLSTIGEKWRRDSTHCLNT